MSSGPGSQCPVRHDFDPFDPTYLADPYPLLAELRQDAPLFYSPELRMWVLTRYRDIEAVFRDPARFSSEVVFEPIADMDPRAVEILRTRHRAMPVLADAQPPLHPRIRRHLMSVFSARRMRVLEPTVRQRAAELVDRLPAGEPTDLVAGLTFPLPALTIFALEGFPEQDVEQLKAWSDDRVHVVFGRLSGERQIQVVETFVAFSQYCEDHVTRRLAEPADDLTTDLLEIHRGDPDELSLKEVTSILFGLSFAGHETTTNVLGNTLRHLGEHPEIWARMREDPAIIPGIVEEGLRYDAPVQTWRRLTREAVEIDGIHIPAGERVLLVLGAANRDPEVFECPEQFRAQREGANRHLAFGKGIHFCQGAPLARMELRIALELLSRRFERLEILPHAFETAPNLAFRGPLRLPAIGHVGAAVA
jgi:cytochrome P450